MRRAFGIMAPDTMTEPAARLARLEYLGDATRYTVPLHALIPKCALLQNFSPGELQLFAHFMDIYRAAPGQEIVSEGDGGDFMLLIVEGKVELNRRDRWNTPHAIATAGAGETLGEMSMIDGEPRFASCLALEPATIAVLHREALARMIVEQPLLGAKILMELVLALSRRLRATSDQLLGMLDENAPRVANVL
jgi:CRP/FNR family transcriptional regulator, cyclic AMP receptor protein